MNKGDACKLELLTDISVSSPKEAGGWVRRGLQVPGGMSRALLPYEWKAFCDSGRQPETKGLVEACQWPGKNCF